MKTLILILAMVTAQVGFAFGGCNKPEPTPTGGTGGGCTGVFKQDAGEFTVYVGNDGLEHKCSKPGGHCKSSSGYNGCSASAEKCCHK